jgi:hypothetical protein
MASVDLAALDEEKLADWLLDRRWFGSKARDVASIHVLDVVPVHDGPPALTSALVEARYPGGTHDVYQLLLGVGSNGGDDAVIDDVRGVTVYDAFADPRACDRSAARCARARVHGEHARSSSTGSSVEPPRPAPRVQSWAEQSNTDRLRRRARAQGLPAGRGGRQPRARDVALPPSAAFPTSPSSALVPVRGRAHGCHPGVAALRAQGATAGSWRSTSWTTIPSASVTRLRDPARSGRMHTVLASDPPIPPSPLRSPPTSRYADAIIDDRSSAPSSSCPETNRWSDAATPPDRDRP